MRIETAGAAPLVLADNTVTPTGMALGSEPLTGRVIRVQVP